MSIQGIAAAKPGEVSSPSVWAQLLWISLFAAATALAARIEIPHQPVPFTLQTMAVLLAGGFLGARNGAASQLLYLSAGALGLPLFAGGAAGIAPFLGPTGGYLLAFPAAAALIGLLLPGRSSWITTTLVFASGLLAIFASGTLYLSAIHLHNLGAAISSGFLIFSWWDVIKLAAATMTYHELAKRWPRLPNPL